MRDGVIELIARGVLIGPHGLLLCHPAGPVGKDYTYLPGGHVEFGETASAALVREMREELQMRVDVDNFLGALESVFVQDGETHHEMNLIFGISSPMLVRRLKVPSAPSVEEKIEFQWRPVNMLAAAHLLPRALRTLIPQWTRGKHMAWASEVEPLPGTIPDTK